MPFLGMPLRFNVLARRLQNEPFLRLYDARLLLRFRPTTYVSDPDDALQREEQGWPSEDRASAIERPLRAAYATNLFLDVLPSQLGGAPEIHKGYWQLVDLGSNGRTRLVELIFHGEAFTADLIADHVRGGDPENSVLRSNLHDAFIEQCSVQLILDLADTGTNIGELLLKLAYEIVDDGELPEGDTPEQS